MEYNSARQLYHHLEDANGFEGEIIELIDGVYRIVTDKGNGAICIADDMVSFFQGEDWDSSTEATRSVRNDLFGPTGYEDLLTILMDIDYVYDAQQELEFVEQYVATALWTSTDDETPLDENYSIEHLSDDTLADVTVDCEDFLRSYGHLIRNAYHLRSKYGQAGSYDHKQAAHDFLLTRNRHGVGFWDRGLGVLGDELTTAAHSYGEVDFYVGDDGKIWC